MGQDQKITDYTNYYSQLWQLARPYYENGRPMDIAHIEWMMADASDVCQAEGLDDSLLLPLCILHDVGYSKVEDIKKSGTDYYDLDMRRFHMDEGAKIARKLLEDIDYPPDKIVKIVYYISVHDNWAYDEVDIYLNDPILGTFKDLDYIWIYTKPGFEAMIANTGQSAQEMLEHLESEPSPIYGKKPFSNPSTQRLHDTYLAQRRKIICG